MEITEHSSKVSLWISYILQAIIVLFFLVGATMNLLETEIALKGAEQIGYDENCLHYLGAALLLSTCLYAIPRFIVLGAILLTGWLGGAVASHVIHHDSVINILFPVFVGILVWLVVILRGRTYQALFPI